MKTLNVAHVKISTTVFVNNSECLHKDIGQFKHFTLEASF